MIFVLFFIGQPDGHDDTAAWQFADTSASPGHAAVAYPAWSISDGRYHVRTSRPTVER